MTYPETESTRHSRPHEVRHGAAIRSSRLGWAAVLAALVVALVALVVFSSGRNPNVGVVPSESPASSDAPIATPSAEPSADPSVAPSPSVGPSADPSVAPSTPPSAPPSEAPAQSPFVPANLGPDHIGRVVATDGLRVRTLPTVGEASQRLEPTLDEGVKFYVVAGPVFADGYTWYQIDPYGGDPSLTPFGWVAAGSREGEAWIENLFDGCDTVYPSIEALGTAAPQENLYCYGVEMPDDYELTGNLYCDFGDVEGFANGPEWLEFDRYCELRAPDWNVHDGISLRVFGKAATSLLEQGSPVDGQYTVVGHFDDPGASECESPVIDGDVPDAAEVVLTCRMQFVVTEVRPA